MVGKNKNMLRALSLLTLLIMLISINHPALASTSSIDQADIQIVDRTRPEFQSSLQGPASIGVGITPAIITKGEMATVTVNINNVPAEGYTSVEVTCTYYPDLVQAQDIVVGDLFGADPVVAIQGPFSDHFVAAIAGSQGRKATSSGALLTFHIVGLQPGLFPITCDARVSTGDQALTNLAPISNDLHVFSPTSTPKTDLCDSAEFVADVTVPPGTVMSPGQAFNKTWLLTNVGTCTWTQAYQLVFDSGTSMSAASTLKFPVSVNPGVTVNISVNMIAPLAAGPYMSNWKLKNANGASFGIGASAKEPFSVSILVSNSTLTPSVTVSPSSTATPDGSTATPTFTAFPTMTPGGPTAVPVTGVAYDFAANACQAQWFSGVGQLPCPGIDGNPNGFVIPQDHPVMESGSISPQHGLLTVPQNVQNGYIQGFYPPFHVQTGDRFRSFINCENGATSCYLAFRLDYQVGNEPIKVLWGPYLERYDGLGYSTDVDLSPLAGKDVKFILTVLAAGSANGDRAEWVNPIIYRSDGSAETPTPTDTQTLAVSLTSTPPMLYTATVTSTSVPTTSGTPAPDVGIFIGKIYSSKVVRIEAYNAENILVGAAWTEMNGNFEFYAAFGTNTVIARADGFLSAQKTTTITIGSTITLPTISLLAGDIDGNNIIDQFDALTIGMNYNSSLPTAADLNNDGIINVLDLELLAKNYRKTGPTVW